MDLISVGHGLNFEPQAQRQAFLRCCPQAFVVMLRNVSYLIMSWGQPHDFPIVNESIQTTYSNQLIITWHMILTCFFRK